MGGPPNRRGTNAWTRLSQQRRSQHAMSPEHADALFVAGDPVFGLAEDKISELAASHKLPAVYQYRDSVAVGGLMSYGIDWDDLNR